jgi:hypothetical protein
MPVDQAHQGVQDLPVTHLPQTVLPAIETARVIAAVRKNRRLCKYLYRAAVAWIAVGAFGTIYCTMLGSMPWRIAFTTMEFIGFGIISVAAAVTQAINRCPLCDTYISRFRKNKSTCGSCGMQIQ